MQRSLFTRQPARMLLIDTTSPFDAEICQNIQEVLRQLFLLACNLTGPCRTPFFALFGLSVYPEVLFPLQNVRGNHSRIYACIDQLGKFYRQTVGQGNGRTGGCITEGVKEALKMFRRQSSGILQTIGYCCQLEVTVITCQNVTMVTKQVEKATKDLDINSLKKVQVVNVFNPDQLNIPDDAGGGSQTSETSETSGGSEMEGLVETLLVEADCLSLQNFFKTWLLDSGTDKEHMHLAFFANDGTGTLTIKCDLQERLLAPSQLPFEAQFSLQWYLDRITRPNTSVKKPGISTSVHNLKVLNLLPADAICESVLFGMPHIVHATSCWKIDWDELESNQQNFYALCRQLQQQDQVLLACMENTGQNPQQHPGSLRPHGHFLLLPAHGNAMLIKPIAVSELLLPCDLNTSTEKPSQDSVDTITEVLDKVTMLETYNPLLTKSGLYESLASLTNKGPLSTTSQGGLPKRKTPSRVSLGPKATQVGQGFQLMPQQNTNNFQAGPKRARTSMGHEFYNCHTEDFPTEL